MAIAATGIFYGLFVGKLRDVSASAANKSIVVAAKDLERGTVIKPGDVKVSAWAGKELPRGAFTSAAQTTGRTVFVPLLANEPLSEEKVASAKSAGHLTIPSGMRAVSVRLPEPAGVVTLVRSGHRVDVQVILQRPGREPELRAVIPDLQVFAVDMQETNNGRPGMPVVTVLATPADANRLALAEAGAKIRLLLRNPLDSDSGPQASIRPARPVEARVAGEPGRTSRAGIPH